MFYTIELYIFICGVYQLYTIDFSYEYVLMCTYVTHMIKTHD